MAKISVSDFLIQELSKLGIKDFFGLPGDYNFNIIDSVENNDSANWIGCTNELNAGYAADGYARINGAGALITTYNVGELSAINAIAGSFAENVPVISIVGLPSTKFIKGNTLLHHNFMHPNYFAAYKAYSNFVQVGVFLDGKYAKDEIESVLSIFIKEKKPVYIGIPADICEVLIENNPEIEYPESDSKELERALAHALKLINKASNPAIIGDCLVWRFGAQKEFQEFVSAASMPSTTFIMGKGLINESAPNFLGTYLASLDNFEAYETVYKSDCVISVGTIFSDFNTLKFDINFKPSYYIEIQGNQTIIEDKIYENVLMKDILKGLTDIVKTEKNKSFEKNIECLTKSSESKNCEFAFSHYQDKLSREISQKDNSKDYESAEFSVDSNEEKPLNFEYISARFEKFLKPNDCIFSETGILNFLVPSMKLPDGCILNTQLLWASIGWATPAAFGACIADRNRRVILLTGEGSHQLTFSEVSNMLHRGVKPIIFVLNNSGYTIERILSKNAENSYNNVIPWDYTKLFEAFNPDAYIEKVKTNLEFEKALNRIEQESSQRICYIEMFTDKLDLPPLMKKLLEKIKNT